MDNLQIFEKDDFGTIRTVEVDGKILFCGSDVAKALGYVRPNDAISVHCRATVKHRIGVQTGIKANGESAIQNIEMLFITEGDVYRLVVHSKLPNAEKFEGWIFDEVLPSIRKHGAYMTPEKLEEVVLNPDMMIKLCTALKEERDKNKALQADNLTMRPKADYFDGLVDRNLLTNFRETAKQLKVKEKAFINFLIDREYIYRDKKGKLMPYADKNDGLFEIKDSINDKTKWSGTQTLITQKGKETFKLLIQDNFPI